MSGKCSRGFISAVVLWSLLGSGCGKSTPTQQGDRAEAVVERVLDAWVRGEPLETFTGTDKSVQMADPDWKAGWRLLSFLTVGSDPTPDAPGRFRCRVALALRDPAGKKVDKEVTYDVQLGQTSVISRVSR